MNRQERYRQEYGRIKPGWRHSLHVFKDVVDHHTTTGARVLDIGCGHADFLAPVYTKSAHVVGCDPDHAALRLNATIPLRAAGLADDLPFRDGTFDAAVLVFVIEHLHQPERVFLEIRRVLRPGGRAIFLTPNAWNYTTWLIRAVPDGLRDVLARKLHGRQERDTYPVRYRFNTVRRIDRVMSGVGFRRIEVILHGDPTYTGLNRVLFRAACAVERLLDRPALQGGRVHIIGAYERSAES